MLAPSAIKPHRLLECFQVVLVGPHATSKEALLASYYNENVAGGLPSFADIFQVRCSIWHSNACTMG